MARTSTYLNFLGRTEEAFTFYREVFGGEFLQPIQRFRDVPGLPPMSAEDGEKIMHVELAIVGGHVLMGTDALESLGQSLTMGTNVHLNLEPDTRAEADRLFAALAAGGKVTTPMQEMFWGAYYGGVTDRFGVQWMVNCAAKA
jgi:PhnB protein